MNTHNTHSGEITLVILGPKPCPAMPRSLPRDINTGLFTQVSVPFGVSNRQEHRALPICEGPWHSIEKQEEDGEKKPASIENSSRSGTYPLPCSGVPFP